jgi:hypothetical protein
MISLFLNLPYTFVGFLIGLLSVPNNIKMYTNPLAVIVNVRSLWWAAMFPWMRGVRAATIGHVILLSKKTKEFDFEHELVHIKQYQEKPFIHPFLYYWQLCTKGYEKNKYEVEARKTQSKK